jgi:hypothetical protein
LHGLRYPIHVKGYADAALGAPERNAAAAHIFAVDFEIEHQRRRTTIIYGSDSIIIQPIAIV